MLFWGQLNFKKGKINRKAKKINVSTLMHTIIHISPKRAVLSASMTLEAAFIMPVVFFVLIAFLHVLNLINFQTRVNEAMYNTSRTLAKTEYAVNGSANMATALSMLWMNVGNKTGAVRIVGGNVGLTAMNSDFSEDKVDFVISYVSKTPFDFLNLVNFSCEQRAFVRKWIGNEDNGGSDGIGVDEQDRLVYITETGTVYHLDRNCTHLRLSIQKVNRADVSGLRNVEGAKYYACERCGGSSPGVYITDTGNRYHNDINCSGLKRMIIVVSIKDVEGWRACSRCGG